VSFLQAIRKDWHIDECPPESHLGYESDVFAAMNLAPLSLGEMKSSTDSSDNNPIILSPTAVNAVVYRASNLLVRNNWADIACGVSILTGRLYAEVMKTMSFDWASEFSVRVYTESSPQTNASGSAAEPIEIPTLCRADRIISAVTKLRAMILTHTLTMKQVKSRYSEGIFLSCGRYFEDLIPSLSEQSKYHPHLFHRLYATIAYYFYCPPWVSKYDFKRYIETCTAIDDSTITGALPTEGGYAGDPYAINERDVIVDENHQQTHGTRLTQPGVQVLEVFRKEKTLNQQNSPAKISQSDQKDLNSARIPRTPLSLEPTTIDQEPKMAKETLSSFELITYSEAYQRAVERGFTGNKREFRGTSTKQPDIIASKFGVQRDPSIQNASINQPTWRDLQAKSSGTKSSSTKASSTKSPSTKSSSTKSSSTKSSSTKSSSTKASGAKASSSAKATKGKSSKPEIVATKSAAPPKSAPPKEVVQDAELELVRKLSTGIDFLSREVDSLRTEKETLEAERVEAQKQESKALALKKEAEEQAKQLKETLQTAKEDFKEREQEKDQKIKSLEQEISSLEAQLGELRQTYQKLEPILNLVRAQPSEEDMPTLEGVTPPSTNGSTPPDEEPQATKTSSRTSTPSKTRGKPSSRSKSSPTTSKKAKSSTSSKSSKKPKSSTAKPKKQSTARASSSNADLDSAVVHALESIMEYNDAPNRKFEEKWAISYPVMKELLTQVGASTQTKIKAVFDARSKDIDQHMRKHKLGKRHNRNHQGESISDVLKLSPTK
jgi:hypothetical protein